MSGAPAVFAPGFLQGDDTASRTLLAVGLLLLVSGFLYGAAYTAWRMWGSDTSDVTSIKDIVTHAAAEEQTELLAAVCGVLKRAS